MNILLIICLVVLAFTLSSKNKSTKQAHQNEILTHGAMTVIAKIARDKGGAELMADVIDQWGKTLDYRDYDIVMQRLCTANGVTYTRSEDGLISKEPKIDLAKKMCYTYK